ncbi:MAG: hypothetical protein Ta2D_13480 [Rickettsiales bacterium]|nr:MAG: hypothetical protein Ta2D_13480 [Rickettsiales bacterium]
MVNKGDNFNIITHNLLNEKIVLKNRDFFVFITKFYPNKRKMQAGEYKFTSGQSLNDILKSIQDGKIFLRKVTIAEGLSNDSIFKIIDKIDVLTGVLPPLSSIGEGTLLPETYTYKRGDTKQKLIDRMQKAMIDFINTEWEKREAGLPFTTKQQLLSLASVVEKETGLPNERGKVASVFVNRLRKGIKLQSDPTVIYGFTFGNEELKREIRVSDLKREDEYNTYYIKGIPEKPICNPGKNAILATLHPEKTDFLFFVATGVGGHNFTKTLEEHNKAVQEYRKIIRGVK